MAIKVIDMGNNNEHIYMGDLTPMQAVNACFEQNRGNYNTWEYAKTLPLVNFTKSGLHCYRGDFVASVKQKAGVNMKGKKPIATTGLTNTGGIAIFDVIYGIDDKVKFAYHDGEKYSKVTTSTIRTDEEGNAYFISFGRKYFLNEFLKML